MEIKKCAQCNVDNPVEQIYCIKCGSYLKKNIVSPSPTIWNTTPKPIIKPSDPITQNAADKVVICPQCNSIEGVTNDILPMDCSNCGYIFQYGVDKIISLEKISTSKANVEAEVETEDTDHQVRSDSASSTPKRKTDNSRLRIIERSDPSIMPQSINPLGDIIGKNGTVFSQLKIDASIKLYRAPTGWYIKVLEGECVIENVHVNASVERQLKHGDCILINQYRFFIEITE